MRTTPTRWMAWGLLALAVAVGPSGCAKRSGDGAAPRGSGSATAEAEELAKLTVDELDAKKKEADAGRLALFVFDNNERPRFDKGHIPGAKWVKFDDVQAKDLPADKAATLVFYCANDH